MLDSLRYDTWLAADPKNLGRLGTVERRFSYASWTAPSHYNKLMGLLPHSSPQRVYASEYYKRDFVRYNERLGVEGIEFRKLLPSIYLPTFLRNELGFKSTRGSRCPSSTSTPSINRDFDTYRLMPTHNDMAAMFDELSFDDAGRRSTS